VAALVIRIKKQTDGSAALPAGETLELPFP
jgi:hypothetical protein